MIEQYPEIGKIFMLISVLKEGNDLI